MGMTGGEAIARLLQIEGVEKVFGIPDGTYWGLISSFDKYGIEFVSPRSEMSALHMAGSYARLTGKIGVCIASNGPGCAAALGGIAVEQVEGNRVMLITSSRRPEITYPDRGGAYQVFDQTGVIKPMSKYSEPVRFAGRVPEVLRQAFRKNFQGRPGVVHVDVPESIINGKHAYSDTDFLQPSQYRRVEPLYPSDDQIKTAAKMLVEAKFPVIHAGSGVIHTQAYEELELIANYLYAPTTTSWAARGALCENNELSVPLIALELSDDVRKESDLILTLGSRLGETDWWGKQPNWGNPIEQKMIQVDIDDEYIGRNKPVTLGVCADAKIFLRKLYEELKSLNSEIDSNSRKEIYQSFLLKAEKVRAKLDKHLDDTSSPLNTAHVSHLCKKHFDNDSIAVFDGGNTAVWGQFFYKCTNPGSGLGTPKMGMLGAGVPQALGAAIARPDKQVYCIIGDGAMGYHNQDIETAVRNNLNITYIVCADKQWGMVKINQQFNTSPMKTLLKKEFDPKDLVNSDFNEIQFDKLGEAMGATGFRVDSLEKLNDAIKTSSERTGCKVIHVDVDRTKHMWAPGLQAFKKMHDEPKGK